MAVKTKTQLHADTAALPAPITRASLITVLDDMIDSWEDYFQQVTTAAKLALTPVDGQVVYDTDLMRLECFDSNEWLPLSQMEQTLVDCSANPNYPVGGVGDLYYVTVAGKIGGAGGKTVYVGDCVLCVAENDGGTEAAVGGSWKAIHVQSSTDTPTYYTSINLSSAQILALNGTPITLVAAGGAGTVIVPLNVIVTYTHVTTAYNAQNVAIKFAAGATAISTIIDTLDTFVATGYVITQPSNIAYNKWYANSALQVWASANPTTGDGTMKVGIYYKIHTL